MNAPRTKILFVIKNLQQGGTEGQLVQTMCSLDPARFEARLCTLDPQHHYTGLPAGEPFYRLQLPMLSLATGRALATIIDDWRPDLVHSFRDRVNASVRLALMRARHHPAWIMSVRGRPVLPIDLLLAAVIRRRAARVLVNSEGIAAALRRWARVPARQLALCHNIADGQRFTPATRAARAHARIHLGLPDDVFAWILPARISYVKNQVGLIVALWLLKRAGQLKHAVVLLPGRVRDWLPGWLVPKLVRWLGLSPHVRLLDATNEMPMFYAAADGLVLPSWAEGMPNVTLEAQLCGVPAVVTHQANRDAIVEAGRTGMVVRTGDPFDLARGMAVLMQAPQVERAAMGLRGRQRVLERFTAQGAMTKLYALYESIRVPDRLPASDAVRAALPVFSQRPGEAGAASGARSSVAAATGHAPILR